MGMFQSEFRDGDAATKKRLHGEAWTLFAKRVDRLVASGIDRTKAEREALDATKEDFMALHPELTEESFAFRVVQP